MRRVRTVSICLALLLGIAGCVNAPAPGQRPAPAPPAAAAPAPAPEEQSAKTLTVGVDDLGSGFNPHLLSDLSPVSNAIAALVLPSVFRPAADGTLVLDRTIATSAEVVSQTPFTVSYELNLEASWSNNAPIAAEDFVYLWQRMRSEPGVIGGAGYRLITDVRSRAGGKAVDVVFSEPYPAWRQLFTDLLPAHLLKDAPQAWGSALSGSVPVSGGPFAVRSVDRARGKIQLVRNDHYWATPAVLDSLTIAEFTPTGLLSGLRSGEVPIVQAWPDQALLAALRELGPAVRMQPVPQPVVVQLGLRADRGPMSDDRLRRAIGAMIDRDALIAVGTADGAGGVRADAQVLAPSAPGYRPTIPAGPPGRPDPEVVARQLTSAGYIRQPKGNWTLLGGQLKINIGTVAGGERYLRIAEELRRQLVAAGVNAQVVPARGTELLTEPSVAPAPVSTGAVSPEPSTPVPTPPTPTPTPTPTPPTPPTRPLAPPAIPSATPTPTPATRGSAPESTGSPPSSTAAPATPGEVRIDILVMPRAVGADPVTQAASRFGCPEPSPGDADPPDNPTGFCSRELQPILESALTGDIPAEQAIARIEPMLWAQLPVIPLFQVVTTLVSTPAAERATGVGPGALLTGPLSGADTWRPVTGEPPR